MIETFFHSYWWCWDSKIKQKQVSFLSENYKSFVKNYLFISLFSVPDLAKNDFSVVCLSAEFLLANNDKLCGILQS